MQVGYQAPLPPGPVFIDLLWVWGGAKATLNHRLMAANTALAPPIMGMRAFMCQLVSRLG